MKTLLTPTEKRAEDSKPLVTGTLRNANVPGWMQLIDDLNKAEAEGYQVVSVVRLDKKVAAVCRLRETHRKSGAKYDLIGEDE